MRTNSCQASPLRTSRMRTSRLARVTGNSSMPNFHKGIPRWDRSLTGFAITSPPPERRARRLPVILRMRQAPGSRGRLAGPISWRGLLLVAHELGHGLEDVGDLFVGQLARPEG